MKLLTLALMLISFSIYAQGSYEERDIWINQQNMQTLRLTTSEPGFMGMLSEPLKIPEDAGKLTGMNIFKNHQNGGKRTVYIHGEAEDKAGYDIPLFIDGNIMQLLQPVEDQQILLLLPGNSYSLKCTYDEKYGNYLLELKY